MLLTIRKSSTLALNLAVLFGAHQARVERFSHLEGISQRDFERPGVKSSFFTLGLNLSRMKT